MISITKIFDNVFSPDYEYIEVIYINDDESLGFKKNNTYTLLLGINKPFELDRYLVLNDHGIKRNIHKNNFITLADWREQQIDNILND